VMASGSTESVKESELVEQKSGQLPGAVNFSEHAVRMTARPSARNRLSAGLVKRVIPGNSAPRSFLISRTKNRPARSEPLLKPRCAVAVP
jgi:hypothetical protein